MIIVNFKKLARNSLRKRALLIAEAGLAAIEIEKTVGQKIKFKNDKLSISGAMTRHSAKPCLGFDLTNYRRIFLVGVGKGSALASAALAKILHRRLAKVIALDVQKPKPSFLIPHSSFLVGTHPLPSKQNIKATQKIVKLAKNLKKNDLLITFICGGGSALLCGSEKELAYSRTIFKELTRAGANIFELNTVRKHLSEVKGGGLVKMAYPADVISLIISDVPGNDLSMVASGPTVFDKTAKKDAERIIKKYFNIGTSDVLKTSDVRRLIRALIETPKEKKYFKKVKNILFVSNQDAVFAMRDKAEGLGLKPKIYSLKLKGEAKKALLPLIESAKKGEAVLAGGETTVTLKNQKLGKGGRNMEAVLGTLIKLIQNSESRVQNYALLSVASDGRDNTEAAGAIADISTLKKAKKLKINLAKCLDNHDSFHFFERTGDLIYTKKSSFNMADLMVIIKK